MGAMLGGGASGGDGGLRRVVGGLGGLEPRVGVVAGVVGGVGWVDTGRARARTIFPAPAPHIMGGAPTSSPHREAVLNLVWAAAGCAVPSACRRYSMFRPLDSLPSVGSLFLCILPSAFH